MGRDHLPPYGFSRHPQEDAREGVARIQDYAVVAGEGEGPVEGHRGHRITGHVGSFPKARTVIHPHVTAPMRAMIPQGNRSLRRETPRRRQRQAEMAAMTVSTGVPRKNTSPAPSSRTVCDRIPSRLKQSSPAGHADEVGLATLLEASKALYPNAVRTTPIASRPHEHAIMNVALGKGSAVVARSNMTRCVPYVPA